jgi:hypothetical protein
VTQKENVRLAISGGLWPSRVGELHPGHKLTLQDVRQIRELKKRGMTIKSLARDFYRVIMHLTQNRDILAVP